MKRESESFISRSRRKERGQALPIVAMWMFFLLGIAALTIDLGNAYASYRQLQAATDAAALAGAYVLPFSSGPVAISTATTYSTAAVGDRNYYISLSNSGTSLPPASMVSGYPQLKCLSTLTGQGISCIDAASANAIVVKEQATVPLYFASLFGITSMNISATSTAAMRGAPNGPFNVVVIVDTTASMADTDSGSGCGKSRITCALQGVQVLLQDLSPCSINNIAGCGAVTAGNVVNPVDVVSLFVFPPVTAASAPDAYCSGGQPSSISVQPYSVLEGPIPPFTYPLPGGITPNTYQIVPFSSDYKTSDAAPTLNAASNLVLATGAYPSTCAGLAAKGGVSTYYAGVIYAAQEALTAQLPNTPNATNVIIMLSDGDAEATTPNDFSGTINGTGTGTNGNLLGTYPSNIDECQQAVAAAQYAISQGTSIYAVSYGSEASGCTSDQASHGGTNLPGVNIVNITPCQTMQNIASDPTQFFSDYTATGGTSACISAAQPTTNLNDIFGQIAADLTHARLIPNNTP